MKYNNKQGKKYNHLSLEEREEIAILLEKDFTLTDIAGKLSRHKSTLSRETRRNNVTKYNVRYRANKAHERAIQRKYESHKKERIKNKKLQKYIIRHLKKGWSPELIAGRLSIKKFGLQSNYESIYQFIYHDRRDLIQYLPQSHKKRKKRASGKNKRAVKIPNRTLIGQRPSEVDAREEVGHWETDTVISRKSKAALQVILERKMRYIKIGKLIRKTAKEMSKSLIRRLCRLPSNLLKTITYDNGTENAKHEHTNKVLKIDSYFCNPYHSWEKGSVENAIGIIRRYFPKRTDFAKITNKEIKRIESLINNRPRKCLGYKTPSEVFRDCVALSP